MISLNLPFTCLMRCGFSNLLMNLFWRIFEIWCLDSRHKNPFLKAAFASRSNHNILVIKLKLTWSQCFQKLRNPSTLQQNCFKFQPTQDREREEERDCNVYTFISLREDNGKKKKRKKKISRILYSSYIFPNCMAFCEANFSPFEVDMASHLKR